MSEQESASNNDVMNGKKAWREGKKWWSAGREWHPIMIRATF